jgi:hypothetical protein
MKLIDIIFEGSSDYTPEYIENIRKQYIGKSPKEFINNEPKLFSYLYNVKGQEFYQNFRRDMVNSSKKVSDEQLRKIASEYDGRLLIDFIKEKKNTYQIILSRGRDFLNDVTKNMVRFDQKSWTDEEIKNEALKYNSVSDFEKYSSRSFQAAKRKGPFIDDSSKPNGKKNTLGFYYDVTKHMSRAGNRQQRIIYVHEFRDVEGNKVAAYVGLTYNPKQRLKSHVTGYYKDGKKIKNSPVTDFIKNNPNLVHEYKELTGYMDENEALIAEREWEEKYFKDGWLILNIKRGGSSLGGGVRIKNEDLFKFIDWFYNTGKPFSDLRKEYPNIISAIHKRQLHKPENGDIFKNFNYKKSTTEEFVIKQAMEYNGVKDLKEKNYKLYQRLIKRKLWDKVKELFIQREKQTNESKLSFKNTIIEMIQHDVDEIATKEKELVGKGAFHNVYPSNKNPNMVYKIGFDEDVNGWVDLFKSRPDIFPKVYGTGYVNIKLKKQVTNFSWRTGEFKPITYNPGDTVKVKYVGVERLNTEKAKQHWNSLANVVSVMSGKSLQTYLTSLGMDEEMEEEFLSIGERIKETGNDFIYNIFVEFYNLIQSVYELKPVADVHVGNYGYDKDNNLKCLDI